MEARAAGAATDSCNNNKNQTKKTAPRCHRAAPSSSAGCWTAHPSPPGTDPLGLKDRHDGKNTSNFNFHLSSCHISFRSALPTSRHSNKVTKNV